MMWLFAALLAISNPQEARMKTTLENGVQVYVAQKKGLPITQVYLVVMAGSIYDPSGKEGLANLTTALLDEGTKHRTEEEIALEIEKIGGRIYLNTGAYYTSMSLTVLSPYTDIGLDVIADMLQNSIFPEERVEKERDRVLSGIKDQLSDPNSVLDREFIKAVYAGHPLGHPENGYLNTVESITREDIVQFYQTYYRPERTYLVFVSDLEPEEALKKVKKYFGTWTVEGSGPGDVKIPDPQPIQGFHVKVFHMPVNQVFVAFGHLGPLRKNPDYNKIRLMNYILGGGGFASRMMQKVRVEKGFAYGVSTGFRPGVFLPGYFRSTTETKVESAHEAIPLMFEVIREMQEEGPTDQELSDAKSYYEGSIPRMTETYSQYARALLEEMLYGLPQNFWLKDVEEIKTLTREDVIEAARKYIDLNNLVMVLVADTSKFDLKKLKFPHADISIEIPY